MKTSAKIKEFIKRHESLKLKSYLCPAGVLTIGYGHTGSDVYYGQTITQAEADKLFDKDLARFEERVTAYTQGVTLRQGQFDALCSLCYNIGAQAFSRSTLLRKVKANPNDSTIAAEFGRWVYAKGVRLPGLIVRRVEEAHIYEND